VERLQLVRALRVPVDPAEHECRVAEVEARQAVDERLVEHVTLVARLERSPERP
jgi:hypothetical protein